MRRPHRQFFPELERALPDSTDVLYVRHDDDIFCGHHAGEFAAREGTDGDGNPYIPVSDAERREFRDRNGYEMACDACEQGEL